MILYRFIRRISFEIYRLYSRYVTTISFRGNGVSYTTFSTIGIPYIMIAQGGVCHIGKNFTMNNGIKGNPIGSYERCTIFADKGASLLIGNDVGISQCALISHCLIKIGNRVKIGGGTGIFTTDFHSTDYRLRASREDTNHRICRKVIIDDDVFIGAHCIILKGVTIGARSIIGAGSVVTHSIPPDEIWAGNPARFIKKLD